MAACLHSGNSLNLRRRIFGQRCAILWNPRFIRSHRMKRLALAAVLAFSCIFTQAQTAKPKVRAITAFVRLDSKNYQHQLADALTVLHKTEAEFKSAGYEIETIRFTTQPLADLTYGLSENEALAFLGQLDQL